MPDSRRILVFLFLLCSAIPAGAADIDLRIQNVGLEGFWAVAPRPTWVRVRLSNLSSRAQSLRLVFFAYDQDSSDRSPDVVFTRDATISPGQQDFFDAPVLAAQNRNPALMVEARDASGRIVARDSRALGDPFKGHLVALLCPDIKLCQSLQARIGFSGTAEEQIRKAENLKFVPLLDPPTFWWAYAPADTVIVATPVERLTAAQRDALEIYLRQGGRLVLVEDQLHDPVTIARFSAPVEGRPAALPRSSGRFLAPYRLGPPPRKTQPVGRGSLFRVARLQDRELADFFMPFAIGPSSKVFEFYNLGRFSALVDDWKGFPSEIDWIERRLGTSFSFPGWVSLVLWMAAYILLVGFLNFAVLRRFGGREWAWLTVPALAVIFAAGIYLFSAAHRPRNFGLDEIALYRLDDASPLACLQVQLRVSSPWRATLTPGLPGEVVWWFPENRPIFTYGVTYTSYTWRRSSRSTEVRLGPPWQTDVLLRQWSYEDIPFRGFVRFPGTVRRVAAARLRNDTGQNFVQALYVDKDNVYFLGAVRAGAEIDLLSARREPYARHVLRFSQFNNPYPATAGFRSTFPREDWEKLPAPEKDAIENEIKALRRQPFQIEEMIRGWPQDSSMVFSADSGFFIGLSSDAGLKASLSPGPFDRKSFALTIVSFRRSP